MPTRRQVLAALAASAAARANADDRPGDAPAAGSTDAPPAPNAPTAPPAGSPPAFGTAPPVGPPISPATLAEAEKLMRVELTAAERAQAAGNWREAMAALMERRTGPKKVAIEDAVAPATRWDPRLPGVAIGPKIDRFVRTAAADVPLPASDDEIAFAPVHRLSRWIESRQLKPTRLLSIYLSHIERYDPKLRAIITLTRELAEEQARAAESEIARGQYRGPLHGIPFGVKDLLDTANVKTTWGAEPFRDRVPTEDAAVVRRLREAGAVLVAKLSLGALALNDVWFGGQTMNPWCLEEGSGGSSAGPAASVAAGLVGFAIGSETGGSIIGPSMRCGVTGLRPTFGRVARTGAMTLCWSLDKLGPMTRAVEDGLLILRAISGPDAGDTYSLPSQLDFDGNASVKGLRVGYFPAFLDEPPATPVDKRALELLKDLGLSPVALKLADWPYQALNTVLFAEAAAAFEELTLSRGVDQLKMQVADAWPNTFRQARFLSAVDFVQADRLRRKYAGELQRLFERCDVLLVPSLRDDLLTITNHTGHPSLTLRTGFVEVTEARSDWAPDPKNPPARFSPPRRVPHGVTLIGRLFDEGLLGRVGIALEKAAGVASERPPGF